jgi:hypothetical protein
VVIPVMVPAPGNVCPLAKLICPLLATWSPVSAGLLVPEPNSRLRVALALAVSLFAGSAIHSKVWVAALPAVLLKAEANCAKGWEFLPAAAVAVPALGSSRVPRTMLLPATSSVVAGVGLLMPIFAVVPVSD